MTVPDLRGIIEYDYDSTGDDYPDRIWLAEGITEATAAGVIYDLTAEVERLTPVEARVAELKAALRDIADARPTEDRGAGWMRRRALLVLDEVEQK